MLSRSISREAWGRTIREPAPDSSPSACQWMTTSLRPWETSGFRLNPNHPPAPRPHPPRPAVPASLTPPPTATVQLKPTKSPPVLQRQPPAAGQSTEAEKPLCSEWINGLCDLKHFIECKSAFQGNESAKTILSMSEINVTDAGHRLLSNWTIRCILCPDLGAIGANKCSIKHDVFILFHFFPLLVNSICTVYLKKMVTWDDWKSSQIFLYIS